MAQITVLLFAIIVVASADTRITRGFSPIVDKVKCATDLANEITTKFRVQSLWDVGENNIHRSTNNLFVCFKYRGFSGASCMAAEGIDLGYSLTSFLSSLDSANAQASKELRRRISQECTNQY